MSVEQLIKFEWTEGFRARVAADAVARVIRDIERREGECTPHALWAAAQDPDSPIHDAFEWDVQKAAESYWTTRARELVRHLRPVKVSESVAGPAFVSVRREVAGEQRQGYMSVDRALADPEIYQQVLKDAMRQAEGFLHRYKHLKEIAPIRDAVERVKHGLEVSESQAA